MGQTIDISEWLDFDFNERVWYWDEHKMDMASDQARTGRWLGIPHRVGGNMTYWILTKTGNVIAWSTVQHITSTGNMLTDAMKNHVKLFDDTLLTRLDDENFQLDLPDHVFYLQDDLDPPNFTDAATIPEDSEYRDMMQSPKPEVDEYEPYDQYLDAEFFVNNNGESDPVSVQKCARDNSGNPIGKRNENPLLDTRREYDCVLDDGSVYRYPHANVIAENIFAQCDDEGRRHAVLKEITDHKKDHSAVDITQGFVVTRKQGVRIPKTTTRGWQ